ncbi:hypothetical protein ERO13_D04G084216v2, partial [Gossypium hirsutum]
MEIKGGVAEIQKDRNTPLVPKESQLPNEKETVYGALDKWVAWEIEFPLIAASKALQIFKKRANGCVLFKYIQSIGILALYFPAS